ncbi:hypothetical protein [Nevskia sp.]|uniref:hypothetical protein n=1 Tax=Nevskia sp. TaxID=1929292 RepID=UPI0025DF4743|nr:hypothetical protein [Nevskia sp.]
MNPQQQREEARRRRLVNRSVTQHRQSYFDDVRRGVVAPGIAMGRVMPRGPMNAAPEALDAPVMIDSPATTLLLKTGIIALMIGLVVQFHAPLVTAVLSLVPDFAG